MVMQAAVALLGTAAAAAVPNMNGDYMIGNPVPGKNFSTTFMEYYPGNEYFEVYSPVISTLYGQVFWTVMDPVPLPPAIVKRFAGKTMAITGYEVDQVRKTSAGDVPVPITAAYNHHHGATIRGSHARLELRRPADPFNPAATHGHVGPDGKVLTSIDTRSPAEAAAGGPASCVLHEGNGGEFRKSFHGYPKGFAQLVDSPEEFVLQPMQIDTWNRDNVDMNGFVPGPEPVKSEALPGAAYSGLLECPCTDRIEFVEPTSVGSKASGTECPAGKAIGSAEACASAAAGLFSPAFIKVTGSATGANASMPPGCSMILHRDSSAAGHEPTGATSFFNTEIATAVGCGGASADGPTLWGGIHRAETNTIGAWVEVNSTTVLFTIAGPADVWFGLGLNASQMSAEPYAVIVDGHGKVTERVLHDQSGGIELPLSVEVVSNKVDANTNTRVVILTRPVAGLTVDNFAFDALRADSVIPVISAYGSGPEFAYHKFKTSSTMVFGAIDRPVCLCNTGASNLPFGKGMGQMIYTPVPGEPGSATSKAPGAPKTTLGFRKNCLAYPAGTMLLEKNPSCDLRAYTGGQSCCHHLFTLLDKNQTTPWQDQPLNYHHKWRIYFQDADPVGSPIKNVIQYNWGGMASPTEYDVPKCAKGKFGCSYEPGLGWVHRMNGTWTVGQMRMRGTAPNATSIKFLTIHGHCHAPTCISFELYNADTNELICRQVPTYGKSNATYDEKGYLSVPPCVFGDPADGLQKPFVLSFGTKLFSTKRCYADAGHHGEMSLWQTYGVFA